jgi:tetratricopeptide (TPR) repeat protein
MDLALQAHDLSAARVAVAEGLAANPGSPTLLAASVAVEKRAGGLSAALARAASLRADPQNLPAALPLAADLLAASGDMAGAAAAYLDVFHQAPSTGLAISAALALARIGRPADATALLAGWTRAHPDDVPAMQLLASLAITSHRLDDAGHWLDEVLAVQHDNPVALNNEAWVKLSQSDLSAARSLAQRAYILAPGPDTQDTLGWTIARQGDAVTALPLLQQAAAGKPDQTVLYHEAFALNVVGHLDQARAALDRALGDPRDFDDRLAAQKLRTALGP